MFFCLGLFIFFCGLELNKRNLKKLNGRFIERVIKSLTENLFLCIFTGIIITAMLQSSSAVSIILISFIEARLIKVKPAIAVMLGANIGTTITVQILSLPILSAYYYLFIAGTFFMITAKFYKKYLFKISITLYSFGMIFWGLNMMSSYFNNGNLKYILIKILSLSNNVIYGIILGGLITAIVQSSSIVTGITLSLARSSLITLPVAVAIALGSNIGTCITAFLASINTGKKAKDLAKGHFLFNLLGVIFFMFYYPLFIKVIRLIDGNLIRMIANAHTLFNIINLFLILTFYKYFMNFLSIDINE